ncbi:tripartite motif-containing protein 66-like, partial [Sinocyclocheilus rhinocerous]|uniref:tripartite motif-containing protein 66-like n=1 Tax=Sinocyclocheilus rhinocerous TaxID=307959 RepID=UPI0007BA4F2A
WIQRRRCPSHTQESLRFFCLVCEELTCKDCQLISHRGHSFVKQEEAVGSQRQRLQSLLDSIRHQKETISSSLLHLEARLQDIKSIKVAAKKMLTQVVHFIYQTLVVRATQMLKEIEALYAEEVGCLLERKTSLNRLEGCQDYIAAFIDKILCTEGHCLLTYTKRIETQVKKLLTQKACTPETMIELHIQIQNELCQHIMKCGFLRIRRVLVPFTSQRTGSTQLDSESVKSSNQNPCASSQTVQMDQALPSLPHPSQPSQPSHSNQATTRFACNNVASSQPNQSEPSSSDHQSSFSSSPSVQVQYHEVMSEQTKHAYSPSLNCVPYFPQSAPKTHMNSSPSVYSQPRLPLTNLTASQINNISESAKCRKAYCPTMQVSHTRILTRPMPIPVNNQTPVTTHPIPANNQTLIPTHPVPANNQTPVITYPMPVNNQTPLLTHQIPVNNQTPLLTHQMPVNNQRQPISVNNQTPVTTHPIPANSQTLGLTHLLPANSQTPLITHRMPLNNQTPVLTHIMPINNQTLVPTHPIPANNQTLAPTHPIPANIQTPVLTHTMPINNQTLVPTHPIPANNQTLAPTHPIPANIQTPVLTHTMPINNQTLVPTHPIPANNQTLAPSHPIPANNQTPVLTHTMPINNQTLLLTHQMPVNNQKQLISVNNQTPVTTHQIPANNQPPELIESIPANNQIPVLIQPIPVNNQTPILIHPIPANNQTPVLIQPIPANNQSTILTHSIPTYNLALILTHPVQTNFLGPGLSFSVQPSIPLTVLSTINTLSLNDATAISNVLPVNPMPSTPIDGNNTLRCKRGTYNSHNLPVKALADSACDQDAGVSSTNFTDTDHLESNLPTSLVSGAAPKEPSLDPGRSSGPSNIHQNSLSIITTTTTTTEKCSSQAQDCQSSNKNYSGPKHWSIGMPTTFRQLVEATCIPVRSLRVSLVRLPISLPPSGQPLPEFHLTADTSTDHIFVQESQGGQVNQVWRWYEDPIASRSSSCSVSQEDGDSSPASDVEFCALCLSAGAALLCAKCGCAFHSDCHIPPVLTKPCKDWVCLLCQDVNETVVYGSEEMRTPSLSLQDQRKCEKLVLGLLCDENKSLLYSATKNHSKTAEFDIILGRLLGKRKPPYRTAAELVSDVWTLFDILMINSEANHSSQSCRTNMVVKLQKSFQQQLNESFGESLHASLLKQSSSKDPETEREKHRNTLKRMREFVMANSGTAAKKSCTDKGNEGDGCGNTTAAEH